MVLVPATRHCLSCAFAIVAFSASALEITVNAGDPDRTLTSSEAASLISSDEDLVKKGLGRLIINSDMSGYGGEIRVTEGYLRCTAINALGDDTKGTIVSDGATLEFGYPSNGKLYLSTGKENVSVIGTGMNGIGALYHLNSGGEQWCGVFKKITLAGDALFGGESYQDKSGNTQYRRFDIRGGQGTLTLNGHTLTIKGYFGVCGANIVPDANDAHGKIVVDGAGTTLCIEGGSCNFNGSSANVLELKNGASFISQDGGPAVAWTVQADNATFKSSKESTSATRAALSGPITLGAGGLAVVCGNGGRMTLGGKISGSGRLTVNATWKVTKVYLPDATSDWTGGMALQNYACVFANALPGADVSGNYTVAANAKLCCVLPPTGDGDALYSAFTNICLKAGNPTSTYLVSDQGQPVTNTHDFAASPVHRIQANDVLQLKGAMRDTHLYALGGDIEIAGGSATRKFDDLYVAAGTLTFRDAGRFETSTNHINIGAAYPELPWLKLANSTFATNYAECVDNAHEESLVVGPRRTIGNDAYAIGAYGKCRGAVEIGSGAVITNLLSLGKPNESSSAKCSCHGSAFIRGGELCTISGRKWYNWIGCYGSGFVGLESGTFTLRGLTYPGGGQLGRGTLYMSGGKMKVPDTNLIFGQYSRTAKPGMGVLFVTGGDVTFSKALIMGKTLYDESNAGSRDQITLAAGNITVGSGMDMGGEPDGVSVLNLNGGVFECNYIQVITNQLQTLLGTGANKPITNSYGYVNFNGGTYRFRRSDPNASRATYKLGTMFVGDPTHLRITSYGKGATFDTQGYTVTNAYAICGPTGQGISSIALPADFAALPDWAYAGAPVVEITGDGTGASAIADFDSEKGRVTGIAVTSPGCDYTTATAKLSYGGFTNEVALVVTLGTPVSGGFTKRGSGTLRQTAVNTYGGKTCVEQGTLVAGVAGAIPAASSVELKGGTLDLNGQSRDFGAVVASSGSIVNATGTMTSLVKTGEGSFLIDAPLAVSGLVDVQGGTLVLPVRSRAGLFAGEKVYAATPYTEYDNRTPLTNLGIDLTPTLAYELCVTDGHYQPHHYVTYSGYVWNRNATNETWTFATAFDDSAMVYVDGKYVDLAKRNPSASWGSLFSGNVELTPGAHPIKLLFWNAMGNGGAVSARNVSGVINWRNDLVGLVYDQLGRNSTNGTDYAHMTDPGDGSLFSLDRFDGTTQPTLSALRLAGGTTLDLGRSTYVYGGSLVLAEDTATTPAKVNGCLSFATGASVTIEGLATLAQGELPKTLVETTDGVAGTLPRLQSGLRLKRTNGGKDLALDVERGLMILVR